VNFEDLGIYNATFGTSTESGGYNPTQDIVADGIVNFTDLGRLNVEFGRDINNQLSSTIYVPGETTEESVPVATKNPFIATTEGFATKSAGYLPSLMATEPMDSESLWEIDTKELGAKAARLYAPIMLPLEPKPVSINDPAKAHDAVFEEIGGGDVDDLEIIDLEAGLESLLNQTFELFLAALNA